MKKLFGIWLICIIFLFVFINRQKNDEKTQTKNFFAEKIDENFDWTFQQSNDANYGVTTDGHIFVHESLVRNEPTLKCVIYLRKDIRIYPKQGSIIYYETPLTMRYVFEMKKVGEYFIAKPNKVFLNQGPWFMVGESGFRYPNINYFSWKAKDLIINEYGGYLLQM